MHFRRNFLGGSYWSSCTRSWNGWSVVCWKRDWEHLHSANLFCRDAGLVSMALALLQAVVACCLLSKKSVVLENALWTQWGWRDGPWLLGQDYGNCLTCECSCVGAQWGWHLLNKHVSYPRFQLWKTFLEEIQAFDGPARRINVVGVVVGKPLQNRCAELLKISE